MTPFFEQYPRFLETSNTGASAIRLNARYNAIIDANRSLLYRRRVLDIASHDGRWSFAALEAGAAHVTGIEARKYLVEHANRNLAHYAVASDRFELVFGDVFEVMRKRAFVAETVLLLGFLYHTDRHSELAELISSTSAQHIILDTNIMPARENATAAALTKLLMEPTAQEQNAVGANAMAVVGHPSREAVRLIFGQYGFSVHEFDWVPMRGRPELADYNEDRRTTFILSR